MIFMPAGGRELDTVQTIWNPSKEFRKQYFSCDSPSSYQEKLSAICESYMITAIPPALHTPLTSHFANIFSFFYTRRRYPIRKTKPYAYVSPDCP